MSTADRIRAAYSLSQPERRVIALVLLAELLQPSPTAGSLLTWSALGSLLGQISIELTDAGDSRADWFRALAELCFRVKDEMRRQTKRSARVIEVAATEVTP